MQKVLKILVKVILILTAFIVSQGRERTRRRCHVRHKRA